MPDDDSLLAQGTVDFRNEERRHGAGRTSSPAQQRLETAEAEVRRLRGQLDALAELAKRAHSAVAAPDYDEEAIRDALWALAQAAVAYPREPETAG